LVAAQATLRLTYTSLDASSLFTSEIVKYFQQRSVVNSSADMCSDTVIFKVCNINGLYLIYLLTAIVLTPGGSSTVHIYTQTIRRTIQLTTLVGRLSGIRTQSGQTKINDELTAYKLSPNWEECGPCPVVASYTLVFALQLRKKHGKTSSG